MSKKKFSGSINGKGYYIALILCAVAIGISGYLYYRHADTQKNKLQNDPNQNVNVTLDDDVPAIITQPNGENPGVTKPTTPGNSGNQPEQKPVKTVSPVAGQTVAHYSMNALCYNETTRDWRVHNGMDIAAEAGTTVCAAADGTVSTVYEDQTMGMTVVISHSGGYTTSYSSLAKEVSVTPGEKVTAGQTIGAVGCTALLETAVGDHIHFGVSCNGESVDPADFLELS